MARTMSKQSSSGSLAPWLGVALIVILFDQLSKIAVARVFTYGEPHALTPFFNLFLIYNRGAGADHGWRDRQRD
jgi:signal peptidase II